VKIAKIVAAVALLLSLVTVAAIRGAAAGTNPATPTSSTIFVANSFDVTAYPADSSGDVAPIVLATNMGNPSGFARDASGRIYVTNATNGTVTVYAANADGNVPPIAVIGGPNTQLTFPTGIALDASGKIYVLSIVGNETSIAVYPPLRTRTGILDEAPVAVVAGSNTLLENPAALALDSRGNIYVANGSGGPVVPHEPYDEGMLTVYPSGSNGNVAPVTTISGAATGLAAPAGIALDADGNIYVANTLTANTIGNRTFYPSITVYPAGSRDNAPPIAILSGHKTGLGYPTCIAVDSSRNLYATGNPSFGSYSVNVYPAGSAGNASPTAIIAGAHTGLAQPYDIAVDSHRNLYVLNSDGGPDKAGSITAYPAGSTGDATPSVTITSNIAGIDYASGIALDSIGNIYLTNELGGAGRDDSVAIYAAGSYASVPPIATIAGDHTKLRAPFGIALDSSGNIAVLNSNHAVTIYPAGSAGDAMPSATINIDRGGYNVPTGIAVNPRGKLYVANSLKRCPRPLCFETGAGDVTVYPAGSEGNAKPSAVIRGPKTGLAFPSAIAVDPSGDIYVANEGPRTCNACGCFPTGPGSVTVYAPGSYGDAKPIATISGPNTGLGLPFGIALDSSGNIYVSQLPGPVDYGCIHGVSGAWVAATDQPADSVPTANFDFNFGGTTGPILIFAAGCDGDVAPIAAIGGPFTELGFFAGAIAVGPAGP